MKTLNRIRRSRNASVTVLYYLVIPAVFASALMLGFKIVNPEAAGSDSAGYLLNSKILTGEYETKNLVPTNARNLDLPCGALDQMLTSRLETNSDCTSFSRYPSYPSGVGIMHYVAGVILGESNTSRAASSALSYSMIIVITILFVYQVSRNFSVSLLSGALLALSKQIIFSTNSNLSDLPSAMWVTLATFVVYKMSQLESSKHKNLEIPLSAIFALSAWMSFLTREVNSILIIPLIIIYIKLKKYSQALIAFFVVVFSIPALYVRHVINGVVIGDSYGGSLWSVMNISWIPRGIGNQIYSILIFMGIAVLFATPKFKKSTTLERTLSAQIICALSFYMFYEFMGETWWDGRFILGVYPALLVLSSLRITNLIQKARRRSVKKAKPQKRSVKKAKPQISLNTAAVLCIALSVIAVNNYITFPNSASSYRYLLMELPKFRQSESVLEFVAKNYPKGTTLVTMEFSASGRYYLGNEYRFLWKPMLETKQYEDIVEAFPFTVWIFNSTYYLPPKEILDKLKFVRNLNGVYVAELQ